MLGSWKINAFITLNWKAGIFNRSPAGGNTIENFLSPFLSGFQKVKHIRKCELKIRE